MTAELFLPLAGRGHVLIDADDGPEAVLVGFHGYGESPDRTLQALQRVRSVRLARWAPRGPHHFYGRHGHVVASWMTRFDRDAQIQQQVAYLRAIFDAVALRHRGRPVFLLGFSQGAATAWRGAVMAERPVAHVFQLAGDMPPEVAEQLSSRSKVGVTLVWGREDTRVDRSTLERDRERLRAAGWEVELHEVDGGHDYLPGALDLVGRRIRAHLGLTSGETNPGR